LRLLKLPHRRRVFVSQRFHQVPGFYMVEQQGKLLDPVHSEGEAVTAHVGEVIAAKCLQISIAGENIIEQLSQTAPVGHSSSDTLGGVAGCGAPSLLRWAGISRIRHAWSKKIKTASEVK
jgi:hypothetical protein